MTLATIPLLAFAAALLATPPAREDEADAVLFSPASIPAFALELAPDAIAVLDSSAPLHDPADDATRPEVAGTFIFDGQRYPVTVKLKGGMGSFRRFDEKPALKLKFTAKKFYGLKRLTLNNMAQDGTLANQTAAYALYAAADVPSPRTGYATLAVNGEDYGLFLDFETQDDRFLARHFADAGGNLYEGPGWGRDLKPADVAFWPQNEGDDASRADLAALAAAVAARPIDELLYGAHPLLDTPRLLSLLAVEVVTGDPDAFSTALNNYRLYHEPTLDRWTLIPSGRDRAFERRIGPLEGDALLKRKCLESPRCRADFAARLDAVSALVRDAGVRAVLDRAIALVADVGRRDPRGLTANATVRRERVRVRDFIATMPATLPLPPDCEVVAVARRDYAFCARPQAFDAAAAACAELGMGLAWLDTPAEAGRIDALAGARFDGWWLGLDDRSSPAGDAGSVPAYLWTETGRAPAFSRWQPGEPNDWHGIESCAHADFDAASGRATWNDLDCGQAHPFVCKRP